MLKSFTLSIATAFLVASMAPGYAGTEPDQPAAADGTWIPLFNGKNLDGWTPKFRGRELGENYRNTFRVEHGALVVSYDEWDKFDGEFGHLFYKDKFSHYRLRAQYRIVGEQVPNAPFWGLRNNGLMVHSQPPNTMGIDQNFPVSIEVQLLGGDGENERSTLNVCTPGTNIVINDKLITDHCTPATVKKTFHGDQLVTAEVEVRGGNVIRHIVNGEVVMEYEKPQLDPQDADAKKLITGEDLLLREGYIAIQAESHPTVFEKIELMVLEPCPVPGDGGACRPDE